MSGLQLGGITPLSTVDYPGELAAVVFCQGCPWRCHYCHNGHLLPRQQASAIVWQDVLDLLERRRGLLDGVVFSGGEPTLQRDLPDAMDRVRAMGFKVGLHTAGCYPQRLAELLPRVDWVGLDFKTLPADYPALTGVPGSGDCALRSLDYLLESGVAHEVRITVHDALLPPDRLHRLVDLLQARGADTIVLQPCRTGHTLSPDLAANGWSHAARCSVPEWLDARHGPAAAG